MRVCVLGSSHVGALKLAYEADPSIARRMPLTFFAARSQTLGDLRVSNGVIEPATGELKRAIAHTSGGLTQIDPSAYDVFLVYGLGLTAYRPPTTFFTRAVRLQAVADHVSETVAFSIVNLLGAAGAKPVFVAHGPLIASDGGRHTPRHDPDYAAGIALLDEVVFAPRNAKLLEQPPETVVNGWHTDRALSIGSRRLDIGDKHSGELHPAEDLTHMNQEFGRIYLEMLERCLNGPSDG